MGEEIRIAARESSVTKPTIAITGPAAGGAAAWTFTSLAVRLAGGIPLRVIPGGRTYEFDGLILGGGADVNPMLYGESRLTPQSTGKKAQFTDYLVSPISFLARRLAAKKTGDWIDSARDTLEVSLLEYAVARDIPILGICRGQQLINVYFGGSLHQSLSPLYVETPEVQSHLPRKRILVSPGTKLRTILGRDETRVNGLHRQGVRSLGNGMLVSAKDKNGIVQAIEASGYSFIIGVQWHPEYLPQRLEQRNLFTALVEAARNRVTLSNTVAKENESRATGAIYHADLHCGRAT